MAWTDLSGAFAYGSKLTSAQMQNLRDNVSAVPAGDAGAPKIVNAAITSGTITSNRLAYNAGDVTTGSAPSAYYFQVLGADGTWRRCSEDIATGGGG